MVLVVLIAFTYILCVGGKVLSLHAFINKKMLKDSS